jgi:G3E family GTPase
VVLLSKLDVAPPAAIAATRAAAAALAPHAPVIERSATDAAAWLVATLRDPPERRDAAAGCDHDHPHDHGVDAVAYPFTAAVDLEQFEDAVAALPPRYFRVKAIAFGPDPRRGGPAGWSAVHRVGGRVSSDPIATPAGGARIVGLGSDVSVADLAACVAAAVLPSERV